MVPEAFTGFRHHRLLTRRACSLSCRHSNWSGLTGAEHAGHHSILNDHCLCPPRSSDVRCPCPTHCAGGRIGVGDRGMRRLNIVVALVLAVALVLPSAARIHAMEVGGALATPDDGSPLNYDPTSLN